MMKDLLMVKEYLIVARGGDRTVCDSDHVRVILFLFGVFNGYFPGPVISFVTYCPDIPTCIYKGMFYASLHQFFNRLIHNKALGYAIQRNSHTIFFK